MELVHAFFFSNREDSMKELSIDETVIVTGGIRFGGGGYQTFVYTGNGDGTGQWDGEKDDH
jgi:hypothetical protein